MIKEVSLVSIRIVFKLMISKVNLKGIQRKERSLWYGRKMNLS